MTTIKKCFYLYTNEGDEFIKTEFKGVWNPRMKRWTIPLSMASKVEEYLLNDDTEEYSEVQARAPKTCAPKTRAPKTCAPKRRKKIHREDSFDENLLNSSGDEAETEGITEGITEGTTEAHGETGDSCDASDEACDFERESKHLAAGIAECSIEGITTH